ncbi:F-box protein SKIP19-like [Apium graveolens]|uniref:F-box protein SKIP19-like n=1 Tax=Apium graveolens TaxID=4045 RepID=UPI003D7A41B1
MASTSNPQPLPADCSRSYADLPAELISSILMRLGAVEVLASARKVCKTWRQICSDPEMWRVIKIEHSDYEKSPQLLKHVVVKAVDLSCGQLVHLDLRMLRMPHNLLCYVFDRSSGLRRLHLSSYSQITNRRMNGFLKRLPFLEELHLECPCNFKKAIEIAGRCCPQLKSLKLINKIYLYPKKGYDEEALAVAENIPGLCRLQIYGPNKMTSDGLLAISENCRQLESLDVCLDVATVGPDLMRRLSEQIKYLRLSYDSSEESDPDLDLFSFLGPLIEDDL